MARQLDRRLAISLCLMMLTASGCSEKMPTSADGARATTGRPATDSAIHMPEPRVFDGGGVRAQGDAQVIVHRDWPSFEAVTPRLTEIDFETPRFERDGVTFRDPNGLHSGFCSSPTCRPDPDNPDGGNIQLFLHPGSAIGFPANTNAAMLIVEGIGDNPFQVRVTDAAGGATVVDGVGVYFGVAYLGFTSRIGISRIEIVDVGGTRGPLALSALRFGVGQKRASHRHPVSNARS